MCVCPCVDLLWWFHVTLNVHNSCVLQAMSERTKEINLHKKMLQAEAKTSEADRQAAR